MNLLRFIAHFSITFFFSFVICAIEVVSFPTARRAYTRVEGGGQDFFLVFSKNFFRLTLPRFTRALQKLRFPAFHANLRHPTPPHHTSPTRVTRPIRHAPLLDHTGEPDPQPSAAVRASILDSPPRRHRRRLRSATPPLEQTAPMTSWRAFSRPKRP